VSLQQVVLLPSSGERFAASRLRRAVVLSAPEAEARARAETLGLPVLVCPELAAEPGGVPDGHPHRLDALIRGHAVADRWRDLVVVADPATLHAAAAGLCGPTAAPPPADAEGVVVVGLPRGSPPVPWAAVAVGAVVVAGLVGLTQDRLHPLVLPGLAAGVGLTLVLPERTRRAGRSLLAVAALAAVLVLVVVAGASRFPVQ
jgi:hypothetical protein